MGGGTRSIPGRPADPPGSMDPVLEPPNLSIPAVDIPDPTPTPLNVNYYNESGTSTQVAINDSPAGSESIDSLMYEGEIGYTIEEGYIV